MGDARILNSLRLLLVGKKPYASPDTTTFETRWRVAAGLNVCGKTYYIYAKGKKIPLCGLCMPELY
jgi:hypothetical protein